MDVDGLLFLLLKIGAEVDLEIKQGPRFRRDVRNLPVVSAALYRRREFHDFACRRRSFLL